MTVPPITQASQYDDYDVMDIDLSTLANKGRVKIYDTGIPIGAVTIVELPVAAVGKVRLAWSDTAKSFQLRQEALPILRSPARSQGLFLEVAAGVAGNLELIIGFDFSLGT